MWGKVAKMGAGLAAGSVPGGATALGVMQRLRATDQDDPTPAEILLEGLDDPRVQARIAELAGTKLIDAGPVPAGLEPVVEDFDDILKRHEGFKAEVHEVDGVLHVGWGHNIEAKHPPEEWEEFVAQGPFSVETCQGWYDQDVKQAHATVVATAKMKGVDFDQLPEAVQWALVWMAFQMGSTRKFPAMWRAIAKRDFCKAAREALSSGVHPDKASDWFIDHPKRASEVVHYLSDRMLDIEIGPSNQWGPTWIASEARQRIRGLSGA